jgi:hypothetical protein
VDQVPLVSEVIGVDEDVLSSTERSDESVPAYLIEPQNPTYSHDTHHLFQDLNTSTTRSTRCCAESDIDVGSDPPAQPSQSTITHREDMTPRGQLQTRPSRYVVIELIGRSTVRVTTPDDHPKYPINPACSVRGAGGKLRHAILGAPSYEHFSLPEIR